MEIVFKGEKFWIEDKHVKIVNGEYSVNSQYLIPIKKWNLMCELKDHQEELNNLNSLSQNEYNKIIKNISYDKQILSDRIKQIEEELTKL